MKILISSFVNNANVVGAVSGLLKAELLSEFHVTVATFPNSFFDRMASFGKLSELKRRSYDPLLKPFIRTWPWFDLLYQFALRSGISVLTEKENAPFFRDTVCQNFDKRVASTLYGAAKKGVKGVYCYEDCALLTFKKAKSLGLRCVYDLPIGYWRSAHRLLAIERERTPEWMSSLMTFKDSQTKLHRKDEELRYADQIFVASTFTAETLTEFPGKLAPVTVIPYGFPPIGDSRIYSSRKRFQPLKLLFVGGLSQRKGIADLFQAVKQLKQKVELTLVGSKAGIDLQVLDKELASHTWIPYLLHRDIIKLMREHDVLILPSLFEGFGLVISEAMSQGTPVITTNRTAGPDLIENGRNGWLVDAGSPVALQKAIEELLLYPQKIASAGKDARETARRRPWEVYGKEVAEAIECFRYCN